MKILILRTLMLLVAPIAQAQSPAPTFEIVSIHQSLADHTARSHILSSDRDGHYTAINEQLKTLLRFAFGLPESQILGGPSSLLDEKFDIEARSSTAVDQQLQALPHDEAAALKQRMLQALYADRFHLVTHHETRQLPVYTLVLAKGGPKLHDSQANGRTLDNGHNRFAMQGVTSAILAEELAKVLGRPVEDKTGLTSRYDLTLAWTPDDAPQPQPADAPPTLFTALQEQLGLKLESTKAPVDVLVIDHLEPPSAN